MRQLAVDPLDHFTDARDDGLGHPDDGHVPSRPGRCPDFARPIPGNIGGGLPPLLGFDGRTVEVILALGQPPLLAVGGRRGQAAK